MAGIAQDQFRAAAADIGHQQALLGMRPLALHAQVNQARFFQTGNHFYRGTQDSGSARQKFRLIAGVAQGGRADDAHGQHIQLAIGGRHAGQHVARQIHGGFVQAAFAKDAGAQAHHLALRRQHLHLTVGVHFRGQHADGIAADIDGCVSGHAYFRAVIFCNTTLTNALSRASSFIIKGLMQVFLQNRLPGRLIVVEGIDGSGKSTQISLLSQWLRLRGYAVAFSEWNSSPLVRETTRRGKKKEMFTPTSFSLIHATDFADRLEHYIVPLLKAGAVVCADRYAYTAFARDVVRGVDRAWVRNLYRFAIKPTLAFYFKVPLDVALGRILGGRDALKYYEAGMDLGLSRNIEESFRIFQGRILEEYESMIEEMGFHVIDATKSIETQQKEMRRIVVQEFGRTRPPGVLGIGGPGCGITSGRPPLSYYRTALPGVDYSELQGKLIVIEGPDAVGRSTQVRRLEAVAGGIRSRCSGYGHGAVRVGRQGHQGSQGREIRSVRSP